MNIRIETEKLLGMPELSNWIQKYIIEDRPRKLENGLLVIPFEDLYQEVFGLFYSKNIIMDDLTAYIEIPISKLADLVPDIFEDNMLDDEQRTFENYLFPTMRKGDTCLALIAHKETEINRFAKTKNAELRLFVETFGNEDLSNIYTHKTTIAEAKAKFTMPILTASNIENMTKTSIIEFIEKWHLDIDTNQLKDKLVIALKNLMGV